MGEAETDFGHVALMYYSNKCLVIRRLPRVASLVRLRRQKMKLGRRGSGLSEPYEDRERLRQC